MTRASCGGGGGVGSDPSVRSSPLVASGTRVRPPAFGIEGLRVALLARVGQEEVDVVARLGAVVHGRLDLLRGGGGGPLLAPHGFPERLRSIDPELLVEAGEVPRVPALHPEDVRSVGLGHRDLLADVIDRTGGVDAVAQGGEAGDDRLERRVGAAEVHLAEDVLGDVEALCDTLLRPALPEKLIVAQGASGGGVVAEVGIQISLLGRDGVAPQSHSQDAKVTVEWEQCAQKMRKKQV